ncbi:hypothetical protein ScPMuIL_000309 [Solemya velum]
MVRPMMCANLPSILIVLCICGMGVVSYNGVRHFGTRDVDIKKVHVVFMNHLDVGYSELGKDLGFINFILNKYFTEYFPRAIQISRQLALLKYEETFIYTTHPWLVSLYISCPPDLVLSGIQLKCPSDSDVASFTNAVQEGYISWHAGPMNMQFEMMDESLADFSLKISEDLDKHFNITRTHRTLSQRDVPGMTAALIPILVKHGIEAVSVGVNGVTAPPSIPPMAIWQYMNSSVITMWHPGGYPYSPGPVPAIPGGLSLHDCHTFPGLDEALCFAFKEDNQGPPNDYKVVLADYEILRAEFPEAQVHASTFESFTAAVQKVKSKLPVMKQEMGDTWIEGTASDPRKTAEMRAFMRARTACLQNSQCSLSDERVYNASRLLIKLAEHTWGISSVFDTVNWANSKFWPLLFNNTPNFEHVRSSWEEQRNISYITLDALQDHPLADAVKREWAKLEPKLPDLTNYSKVWETTSVLSCNNGFKFQFSSEGHLVQLFEPTSKINWASSSNPIGQFVYQTLNQSDFDYFNQHYPYSGRFQLGIGKPNISKNASPESKIWKTILYELYQGKDVCSFAAHLRLEDESVLGYYGAPKEVWISYSVSGTTPPGIDIDVQWFLKSPTRLPEALYFSFFPTPQESSKWFVEKMGKFIDPLDVMVNGSQRLHAVQSSVCYVNAKQQGLKIVSPDVAIVSIATTADDISVIPLPLTPIQKVAGVLFNLFNNIWDVNYIFWYPYNAVGMDQKFRFHLDFGN